MDPAAPAPVQNEPTSSDSEKILSVSQEINDLVKAISDVSSDEPEPTPTPPPPPPKTKTSKSPGPVRRVTKPVVPRAPINKSITKSPSARKATPQIPKKPNPPSKLPPFVVSTSKNSKIGPGSKTNSKMSPASSKRIQFTKVQQTSTYKQLNKETIEIIHTPIPKHSFPQIEEIENEIGITDVVNEDHAKEEEEVKVEEETETKIETNQNANDEVVVKESADKIAEIESYVPPESSKDINLSKASTSIEQNQFSALDKCNLINSEPGTSSNTANQSTVNILTATGSNTQEVHKTILTISKQKSIFSMRNKPSSYVDLHHHKKQLIEEKEEGKKSQTVLKVKSTHSLALNILDYNGNFETSDESIPTVSQLGLSQSKSTILWRLV